MVRIGRPARPAPSRGSKQGHLTVLEECRRQTKGGTYERALRVQCDCENQTIKVISFGAFGRTLSCGCVRNITEVEETSEESTRKAKNRPAALPPVENRAKRVDADGRTCTGVCGRYRPWSDFYPTKSGHEAECIACMAERRKRPARFRIDDDGRQCTSAKCGYAYQPWSNFNKGNAARNRSSWCKTCLGTYYADRTPEAETRHKELLKKLDLHNLSYETYMAMQEESDGNCHRCRQPEPIKEMDGTPRPLMVDYDKTHCNFEPARDKPTCGICVRGLVCSSCGFILDNVSRYGLESLVAYLSQGPSHMLPSFVPEVEEPDDSPIEEINPALLKWADIT